MVIDTGYRGAITDTLETAVLLTLEPVSAARPIVGFPAILKSFPIIIEDSTKANAS
jgi:hypothetical protein